MKDTVQKPSKPDDLYQRYALGVVKILISTAGDFRTLDMEEWACILGDAVDAISRKYKLSPNEILGEGATWVH